MKITTEITTALRIALLSTALFMTSAHAGADELRRGPSSAGRVATGFASWSRLTPLERRIFTGAARDIGDEPSFASWVAGNDDLAAAALASVRALERIRAVGAGAEFRLTDLIVGVDRLEGDRIKVYLDVVAFERWRMAGGRFEITRADGGTETGSFDFGRGGIGGSLHDGYDIQGFTSAKRVPRVQINYRFADGAADIDVDYIAPLKWGVIPNPSHLTWGNSDVRDHLEAFVAKFGDPGFSVRSVERR